MMSKYFQSQRKLKNLQLQLKLAERYTSQLTVPGENIWEHIKTRILVAKDKLDNLPPREKVTHIQDIPTTWLVQDHSYDGEVRIAGTNIIARDVLYHLQDGWKIEDLAVELDLIPAQIKACLDYAIKLIDSKKIS